MREGERREVPEDEDRNRHGHGGEGSLEKWEVLGGNVSGEDGFGIELRVWVEFEGRLLWVWRRR